jgi:hypothetical protein
MRIDILQVSIEDKGKYKMMEVAYKGDDGKVNSKKVMSFGAAAEVFKRLSSAKQGDAFEIKSEKNDKGYWDWIGIDNAGAAGSVSAAKPGANPSPKSTYETPEERANKQVFIVRQSSLSNSIEFLKLNSKKVPTVQEVVEVAQFFEGYVFGKTDGPKDSFEDLESDVL